MGAFYLEIERERERQGSYFLLEKTKQNKIIIIKIVNGKNGKCNYERGQ